MSAPFETIHSRILEHPDAEKKLRKRPLFQDIEKAIKLYDERSNLYKKVADVIIDVSNKELGEIAKEILKKVK